MGEMFSTVELLSPALVITCMDYKHMLQLQVETYQYWVCNLEVVRGPLQQEVKVHCGRQHRKHKLAWVYCVR